MYKLPSKSQIKIKESLTLASISKTIKSLLEKFFQQVIFEKEYPTRSYSAKYKKACLNLINGIEIYVETIEDINWQNYCNLMQYFKSKYEETLTSFENDVTTFSRRCLLDFYLFVIKKQLGPNNRQTLESHIALFIDNEVAFFKKYIGDDLLNKHIRTNFPIDSFPDKMVAVKEGDVPGNLFINCVNIFLFEMLKNFLVDGISYRNIIQIRLFFYYFEESLGDNSEYADNLSFFNFDTFKLQYLFFKQIETKVNNKSSNSPVKYLVKFYLYIDQMHYVNKGTRLFTARNFNRELLVYPLFLTHITQGYEVLYKKSYEPVPTSNKWVLLHDENTNSSQISKNNCMLDFTKIDDENLRQDLKEFIWQQNLSNTGLRDHYRVISKFLNAYNNYQVENVIYLNKVDGISSDFLMKYRAVLEMRNTIFNKTINYRTVNNELKILEKFLRHYKEKYKVDEVLFQILKSISKRFYGGNPIEAEEFEAIANEFRKNATNVENELFFIIFQLTSTTKLRMGEIINLERDCIKSISEALGYGEIEYVSKTSHGEKIREILLLEDINLIKRALELTETLVFQADEMKKKYIFLIKHGRFENIIIKMKSQYRAYFKNIIKTLKEQGLINNDYIPYNARHTFIDNAWGALEDGLISDVEVIAITGNTPEVASQHYRKYKTKKYVEATYKLSIGGVQLDGTILQDEQLIEKLPQVQRGAGGCISQECIKNDSDDTDYKCLLCKKFVTSIQRLEFFEDKLKEIQRLKLKSNSSAIIDYFKVQEKLYGLYLAEILALSEEVADDTVR